MGYGASTRQPPSLGLAWNLFHLMVGSPASLATAFAGPSDADDYIQRAAADALKVEKVNDVIWEFDASRDYDPSAGLGLIQAPLLAVNFAMMNSTLSNSAASSAPSRRSSSVAP